jgi:hypothetical protein
MIPQPRAGVESRPAVPSRDLVAGLIYGGIEAVAIGRIGLARLPEAEARQLRLELTELIHGIPAEHLEQTTGERLAELASCALRDLVEGGDSESLRLVLPWLLLAICAIPPSSDPMEQAGNAAARVVRNRVGRQLEDFVGDWSSGLARVVRGGGQ